MGELGLQAFVDLNQSSFDHNFLTETAWMPLLLQLG
jgi:hypothetical protein